MSSIKTINKELNALYKEDTEEMHRGTDILRERRKLSIDDPRREALTAEYERCIQNNKQNDVRIHELIAQRDELRAIQLRRLRIALLVLMVLQLAVLVLPLVF